MDAIPSELYYTATHEWVQGDPQQKEVLVGITEHAQELLGDLVSVRLPQIGERIQAGDEIAVLESDKAASDVYSPLTGEILEINEALEDSPGLVNRDPYGDGWLFKLKVKDPGEFSLLLGAEAYEQALSEGE